MFYGSLAQQGSRGTSRGDARPGVLPPRPVGQSKMAATMKKAVSAAGPGSEEPWAGGPRSRGALGAGGLRRGGIRGAGATGCAVPGPALGSGVLLFSRLSVRATAYPAQGRASPPAPNRFLHPGMSGTAPLCSALNRPCPTTLRAPSVYLALREVGPSECGGYPGFS